MLRPHQNRNTHGCCGYIVITSRFLETPRCLLTRPDTTKKVQPFSCKLNRCALTAPLSMVLCLVLRVAYNLSMDLWGPKYSRYFLYFAPLDIVGYASSFLSDGAHRCFVWVSVVEWGLLHNWSPHRSRSNHSYWASSLNVNTYVGCYIFAFLLRDNDLYTMFSLLTCIYLRNFSFRQSQMLCICRTFPLSYRTLCIYIVIS